MKLCFLSSYIFPLKRIKTISDLILLKYTFRAPIYGTEISSMVYEEGCGQTRAYVPYYPIVILHIRFLVFCYVVIVIILQERSHCDVKFEVRTS